MKFQNKLYTQIQEVSNEVRKKLRRKGLVVPVKNNDGSISVGKYLIKKNQEGYYIEKNLGEIVARGINLPQTAVITANNLALGRFIDYTLINDDRHYGSALFEEDLTKKILAKTKNLDKWDLMTTKCMMAQARKNHYKDKIVNSFKNFENSYK